LQKFPILFGSDQKSEFVWFLHLSEVENEADESESVSEDDKERVGIYLGRLEDSKESTVSLYCQLCVDIIVNNRSILSKPGNKFIFRLTWQRRKAES